MDSMIQPTDRPTGIAAAVCGEGFRIVSAVVEDADSAERARADISGDPEFDLFDATGGLTADALEYLADIDRNGGFV